MFICKTDRGYISEYNRYKYITRENCNSELKFSELKEDAYLFDESYLMDNEYLKSIHYVKIETQASDRFKLFCMEDWLGDTKDKTGLTKFERQYFIYFTKSAKWIESEVKMPLMQVDFESRVRKTNFNPFWMKLIEYFIRYFYIDIYNDKD